MGRTHFSSDPPAQGKVAGESWLVGQTVQGDRIEIRPCHDSFDHSLHQTNLMNDILADGGQVQQQKPVFLFKQKQHIVYMKKIWFKCF